MSDEFRDEAAEAEQVIADAEEIVSAADVAIMETMSGSFSRSWASTVTTTSVSLR